MASCRLASASFSWPFDLAATVNPSAPSRVNHTVLKRSDPDLWRAVNPYTHIGRNPRLRIRLVQGQDADVDWCDVRPHVSVDFHQALSEVSYDSELIMVEGATHSDLPTRTSEAFAATVRQVMDLAQGSNQACCQASANSGWSAGQVAASGATNVSILPLRPAGGRMPSDRVGLRIRWA